MEKIGIFLKSAAEIGTGLILGLVAGTIVGIIAGYVIARAGGII